MAKRTREGIEERERALIAELYPSLRRFAAVVGPIEVDPDDLVQEAFVQNLVRGGLAQLDTPTAYLRRTIVNLASNHRRRLGRRHRALQRVIVPDSYQPSYPSDVAELLRLSPRTRAVLYLVSVEGQSYAEVAEVLDCSEPAARATASRGRRRLRALLVEEARNESA
ncbi:MAG: RNA polymerase sigma factor [Acidimicrobiia bacterium]|nr:RNA polymerase sigma factor [Acidimicrobiia bacterium]MBT8217636.1 RNA polymerase sigma factor [Acidimicrobiia bacterium]NNF09665.1 RNA polymerase sigma factor [Acidimicrobiia bacterium]NNL68762.1 RNA polymerase sigma factor [Acidimicrobiia bacterium]